MPRRKTTKLKTLGQDGKGRYFRNLGWLKSATGKYSQKKFYFGYDEDHAYHAAARLEALWKCIQNRHEQAAAASARGVIFEENAWVNYDVTSATVVDGYPVLQQKVGKPIWTEFTSLIAEAIRQGEPVARVPLNAIQGIPEFRDIRINCAAVLAPVLDKVRQWFPVIHVEVDDEPLNQEATNTLADRGAKLLADGRRLLAEPLSNQTLHYAISAYIENVRRSKVDSDGETTEWAKAKIRQILFIQSHTVDLDLSQLAEPSIVSVLQILANRPYTQKGKPCTKSFAGSCIKEFRKFLQWLDSAENYFWNWPTGFEYSSPRVVDNPADENAQNVSRQRKARTYSIDELTTIYDYADPIQRLYLLLGLNCGFGNAELVTFLVDDIFLRQVHPDEELFGLSSTADQSWIARTRTKTNVLGTWKLWPETVQAIDWWSEQRKVIETDYETHRNRTDPSFEMTSKGMFLLTKPGKPIAEKNRRTGRIANSWTSLLSRIHETKPSFKRLSFKYLRKTGSSLVRKESSGELASIYLAHGRPYGNDKELEVYADRQFGQLFDALDTVHSNLEPLWAKVTNPFPGERKLGGKDNLTPEQIREIDKLWTANVSAENIATLIGVHKSTVYRRLSCNKPK